VYSSVYTNKKKKNTQAIQAYVQVLFVYFLQAKNKRQNKSAQAASVSR